MGRVAEDRIHVVGRGTGRRAVQVSALERRLRSAASDALVVEGLLIPIDQVEVRNHRRSVKEERLLRMSPERVVDRQVQPPQRHHVGVVVPRLLAEGPVIGDDAVHRHLVVVPGIRTGLDEDLRGVPAGWDVRRVGGVGNRRQRVGSVAVQVLPDDTGPVAGALQPRGNGAAVVERPERRRVRRSWTSRRCCGRTAP